MQKFTISLPHTHTHNERESADSTFYHTAIINLRTNRVFPPLLLFVWSSGVVKQHREEDQGGKKQGKSAEMIRKRHKDGQRGGGGWMIADQGYTDQRRIPNRDRKI